MQFVFGPVPSKRLGQSLGIDTLPSKTCNWNCIYCQLGRTNPLCSQRSSFFQIDEIMAEVKNALAKHQPGEIDWITFVGAGEPTLDIGLGEIIRQVKGITTIPVAVITNGSLLHLPDVQQDLLTADAVLPSLDAGSDYLYRRINRPHPKFSFEEYINGLIDFGAVYSGKMWLEIMLVKGKNDSEAALQEIAGIIQQINPNQIHINVPNRPPAELWVQPPDEMSLQRAKEIFGELSQVISPTQSKSQTMPNQNLAEMILSIVTRHPMLQEELEQLLANWDTDEISKTLEDLTTIGKIQPIQRFNRIYWSNAGFNYPEGKD